MTEHRRVNWKETTYIWAGVLLPTLGFLWALHTWRTNFLENEFAKKANQETLANHIQAAEAADLELKRLIDSHYQTDLSPDATNIIVSKIEEVMQRQIGVLQAVSAIQSDLNAIRRQLDDYDKRIRELEKDRSHSDIQQDSIRYTSKGIEFFDHVIGWYDPDAIDPDNVRK